MSAVPYLTVTSVTDLLLAIGRDGRRIADNDEAARAWLPQAKSEGLVQFRMGLKDVFSSSVWWELTPKGLAEMDILDARAAMRPVPDEPPPAAPEAPAVAPPVAVVDPVEPAAGYREEQPTTATPDGEDPSATSADAPAPSAPASPDVVVDDQHDQVDPESMRDYLRGQIAGGPGRLLSAAEIAALRGAIALAVREKSMVANMDDLRAYAVEVNCVAVRNGMLTTTQSDRKTLAATKRNIVRWAAHLDEFNIEGITI